MKGSGTFVGGSSPVSELMGVVSEGSEYWSPKGDNVICSYLGEVGRERKRVHVCAGVHVYVWYLYSLGLDREHTIQKKDYLHNLPTNLITT